MLIGSLIRLLGIVVIFAFCLSVVLFAFLVMQLIALLFAFIG